MKDSHHHKHAHRGLHVHPVVKNLRIALLLNVSFTVIEFLGGLFTNSMAILSDAIHDLGDSIAIGMSLVLEKKSKEGRTPHFTYGKRRFSIISALATSLILMVGSLLIFVKSVSRIITPEAVEIKGVIWLAIMGLLFNGIAFFKLFSSKEKSFNQKAIMLHLLEDVLGWIAVMAGGIIMYFTHWLWIDPLLSMAVALFIFYNAAKNIYITSKVLLQMVPDHLNPLDISDKLIKEIPAISAIHDVHVWSMDGEYNVLTLHVVLADTASVNDIHAVQTKTIEKLYQLGIQHPTVQVEPKGEHCHLSTC